MVKRAALAAKGGGVIFGMSLFARQSHWKVKFATLASCEDKLFTYGLPSKLFR